MTPERFWANCQRRGVSRQTVEYIIRQRDLEIPVTMIVRRLKGRREADRKAGKSSTNFRLSENAVWNIIYQHRRIFGDQKQE